MKRFSSKFRFYLVGLGAPLVLAILWSGRNAVDLVGNYRQIYRLNRLIKERSQTKSKLETQAALLEGGDPAVWRMALRQEAHALFPNEVEYRFSSVNLK